MIDQLWPDGWMERLTLIGNVMALALVVLLPVELVLLRRAGRLTWAMGKEMLASASTLLPLMLLGGPLLAFFGAVYGFADELSPWEIPTNGQSRRGTRGQRAAARPPATLRRPRR